MAIWLSIGKVAELFGVNPQTIRNWEDQGKLSSKRTLGNHRRFNLEEMEKVQGVIPEKKETILYSRVSSHDQKEDMERQTAELKDYCETQHIDEYEVIEDLGSGINYHKKGLKKLISKIVLGQVDRIIINYKDRLVRFGSEIIFQLCRLKNVEIIVLHKDTPKSFETNLVEDVLAILIVFCSRIYGRRSHEKNSSSAVA